MIMLDYHDFTQETPIESKDPEKRFVVYCGTRELPTMATFNALEDVFYTLSGKMIMNATLWFEVPKANGLWSNLGKGL